MSPEKWKLLIVPAQYLSVQDLDLGRVVPVDTQMPTEEVIKHSPLLIGRPFFLEPFYLVYSAFSVKRPQVASYLLKYVFGEIDQSNYGPAGSINCNFRDLTCLAASMGHTNTFVYWYTKIQH
jgi:hypothetical protein